MTPKQIAYGKLRLAEYAKEFNLPQRKIAEILNSVYTFQDFFAWVNSDDFLCAVENNEITLEDD